MKMLATIAGVALIVAISACESDPDTEADRAAATRSFVTDTTAVPSPEPRDSPTVTPPPASRTSAKHKRRGRRSVIRYPDGGFCVTEANGDFYCSDAAGQDQAWGGANGGGSYYHGESRGAPRP